MLRLLGLMKVASSDSVLFSSENASDHRAVAFSTQRLIQALQLAFCLVPNFPEKYLKSDPWAFALPLNGPRHPYIACDAKSITILDDTTLSIKVFILLLSVISASSSRMPP